MDNMFQLLSNPLESINLREGLASDEVGALVCFEGLVRNHNEGKSVVSLEYEAFDALCIKEALKVMQEAQEKFDIFNAKCFHRVGKLDITEMAVWVGVTSVHRDAAFEACRYIIDEIKFRIPIWKKEYYENGDSGWVNCEECSKAHHH